LPKKGKTQPTQICQLLPGTNCKKCGLSTCFAFAYALSTRSKKPEDCPDLLAERYRSSLELLNSYFGKPYQVGGTGLYIDRERCNGCGDCVIACTKSLGVFVSGVGLIGSQDKPAILKVVDGIVEAANWNSCKRCQDPPVYCHVCEEKCPFGALELVG